MEVNKFIDEILDRHQYYINIYKVVEGPILCIQIDYTGREDEAYAISYTDDLFAGIQYYSDKCLREKTAPELFCLPSSIVRLYIFMSVMKRLNEKNLSYGSIRFYDENNVRHEGLNDLIPAPILEEDQKLENELDQLLGIVLNNKENLGKTDSKLREMGVYNTFHLLKGLLI